MSSSLLGLADGWGNIKELRFNKDHTLFTCCGLDGFRVFHVDPISELLHYRADRVGSIAHCEVRDRSNLIAVICHEKDGDERAIPLYSNKYAFIFDTAMKMTAKNEKVARGRGKRPEKNSQSKDKVKEDPVIKEEIKHSTDDQTSSITPDLPNVTGDIEDQLINLDLKSVESARKEEPTKTNSPGKENSPEMPKTTASSSSQQRVTEPEKKTVTGAFVYEFGSHDKALNVTFSHTKLLLVCHNAIHVYAIPGRCRYLYSLTTRSNPLGLCQTSPLPASASEAEKELCVFPGHKLGSLRLVDLATTDPSVSQAPVTINAHKSELQCISINKQSTMIATASTKGTLIRIWDSRRRVMLVELRRGTDQALLHCISFSDDDQWLCCSSDKGTVHIFALQNYSLNKRSALATIGVPGAYAGSQWSLASFTVPQECPCICTFGKDEDGVVFAACIDGSFHKYHFTHDGKCNQMQYDKFTALCEDCEWEELRK